jgi:hypothetical protein
MLRLGPIAAATSSHPRRNRSFRSIRISSTLGRKRPSSAEGGIGFDSSLLCQKKWAVTQCRSEIARDTAGTFRFHLQGRKVS